MPRANHTHSPTAALARATWISGMVFHCWLCDLYRNQTGLLSVLPNREIMCARTRKMSYMERTTWQLKRKQGLHSFQNRHIHLFTTDFNEADITIIHSFIGNLVIHSHECNEIWTWIEWEAEKTFLSIDDSVVLLRNENKS